MRKIETLKTVILEALPELARDADRIKVWIERGTARSTQSANHGFVFAFQLNVLVVEMASDIAILALAVFRWLRTNQPDLMMPGTDGFSFDADIMDNGCADVLIQLQLDQAVAVTDREGGGYNLDYRSEPDPLFDDLLGILGADPVPLLAGVTATDDLPPWDA